VHSLVIGELNEVFPIEVKEGNNKPVELCPSPNNKSFPKEVNEVTFLCILVARSKNRDDP
jgi:hypothetical protein